MQLFNKRYFSIYNKNGNVFGSVSKKIINMEYKLSKRYPFFHQALNIIFRLEKNAKVLDVGCGIGNWIRLIHKYRPDIKIYGADIGDVEEALPKYVIFKKSSGDNLPFKDNYFDYVTNMHVLEHVQNPQDFVNEFYRVLKKGGYCYIETPHLVRTFFPDKGNFYNDYTHIKPFVISGLKRLMIDYNFLYIKGGKNKKNYIMSVILVILMPIVFIKWLLGFDEGGFYSILDFLLGGSCYGIGKKTK